jgi:hypothetical protein
MAAVLEKKHYVLKPDMPLYVVSESLTEEGRTEIGDHIQVSKAQRLQIDIQKIVRHFLIYTPLPAVEIADLLGVSETYVLTLKNT